MIVTSKNHGGGFASRGSRAKDGPERTASPGNEADRKNLLQDLAGAQVRGGLQALGGAYDDGFRRKMLKRLGEDGARVCGRDHADDDVNVAESFSDVMVSMTETG